MTTWYTEKTSKNGFTVVELLIVIVVIAILTAISIVGYNGIQNRAAETVLQSDLKNAATQLEVSMVTDGSYAAPSLPSTVKASNGTTFTYTSDGTTYCLTATSSRSGAAVYHVSSDGAISQGACSGQGDGGGITGTILGQWDSGALPTIFGSGVSYQATGSWNNGPAIQFDQQAGSVSAVRFSFTSRQNVAVRAYIQMPASWASGAEQIIGVRPSASDTVGQAVLAGTGNPGQMRLVNHTNSNNNRSASGVVSTGVWYRFELRLDQANGRARLGVFALASDVAIWDTGWVSDDFGTSADRVDVGPGFTSPTMGTVRAANIVVTDDVSNWIGRTVGDN